MSYYRRRVGSDVKLSAVLDYLLRQTKGPFFCKLYSGRVLLFLRLEREQRAEGNCFACLDKSHILAKEMNHDTPVGARKKKPRCE